MSDSDHRTVKITLENRLLSELALSWQTVEYSTVDGIGPMGSLHEAGDALVAVARYDDEAIMIIGSGVMVGPGLLLTATHVLDEFPPDGPPPLFLTFLPDGTRAWLPRELTTVSGRSQFDERRKIVSDITLVSCSLNSEEHATYPLTLAPMEVALPLVGDRLWAMGYRHQGLEDRAALITPYISSGLVTAAFPQGRGERMASPCFEVDMDTLGGMSGGAVVNASGNLIGIVSSSLEGGPSHVTLIWEALRYQVRGTISKLMTNETVSLIGAKTLGLAKLKGNVIRSPFGDVTLSLTEKEIELVATSIADEGVEATASRFHDKKQLEFFLEAWEVDLESAALEGAIGALNRISILKAREFLEHDEIPSGYLEAIVSFFVVDFDGVEDLTITGTEVIDERRFRLDYYFDAGTLIWTVEVLEEFARDNVEGLAKYFFNVRSEGGSTLMEVYQRHYFQGSAIFDENSEVFTDVAITLSALKPKRKTNVNHS